MLSVLFEDYGPGIKYLIATLAIIAIVLAICVCDTNGVIYSAFTNLIESFLTRANALAGFQVRKNSALFFRGVSLSAPLFFWKLLEEIWQRKD